MTETLSSMGSMPQKAKKRTSSRATPGERAAVAELVKAARARGDDIIGPDGLLKSITATVLESALEWAGHGSGESAKFWMSVLTEIKYRGVADVFFIVCDGLKGLPGEREHGLEARHVQACVIHLIRATFRHASRKYWDQLACDEGDLCRGQRRSGVGGVRRARAGFPSGAKWGKPYPAIANL